jgi:hypothetical protein
LIRIEDPSQLGPALGEIRKMLGISRLAFAREIAEATGRSVAGVVNQLQAWDDGTNSPTARAIGPVLDALGYDLVLLPKAGS